MREITDPNLLAQLNGTSAEPIAMPKEVSDPALLAQLNGEQAPAPPAPLSFADRIKNALSQGAIETGREIGLGGRAILQGVASPVTLGSDILGAGVNYVAGKEIIPSLGGMVSETLTNIGFPEAKTTQEKIATDLISGSVGGAGVAGAGQKAVGLLSGAGGALGAGATQEAGLPLPMQIGAGLVGGLAGGGIGGALKAKPPVTTPALLEDASRAGIAEASSFNNLRENLQNVAARKQEQISKLYTVAKERGKDAFITKDATKNIIEDFRQQAVNEIDADAKNILNATVSRIDELAQKGDISLNDIEGIRRSASKVAQSGGSKGFIGGNITGKIDDILSSPENIIGDVKAAKIWNTAIAQRRDYGRKFEKPQAIAKALTDDTNEAVEQTFIGSGGAALNKQLAKTYDDTLRALPAKQKVDAGFQLRQSIINRMIKNSAQSTDTGEGLSASRLANQIDNFEVNNQSMWKKFPETERKQLVVLKEQLRKTAEGGAINKAYAALGRIINRKTGQNIELPRTLKPKTIVTMDDLTELMNFKPTATIKERAVSAIKSPYPISTGINAAINNQ